MPDDGYDDAPMPDADDDHGHAPPSTQPLLDLDSNYPHRPHNHSQTLPFHTLHTDLFFPLLSNKARSTGGHRIGLRGPKALKPHEQRFQTIHRFISRWRQQVGDDIFPLFRLIMPDKDRSRTVYGLKEKGIASLFVKCMKIDKRSEDAQALINWKLPGAGGGRWSGGGNVGGGGTFGVGMKAAAGDFAGRCYEVIKKRPMRTEFGDMTVEDVNNLLDKLSMANKEEQQLPIFQEFYNRMNPEELMWIVRIILKQMKVGATEKTFFQAWHPDAENLFNVSSSLKRVCWELYDPTFRLDNTEKGVTLMSCFQPQLAQFQKRSLEETVKIMQRGIGTTDTIPASTIALPPGTSSQAVPLGRGGPEFWIEEKLDGERMQIHMKDGEFRFWSRKAKDYTYLYGGNFEEGSLTRYLKEAFNPGVRNIILDGEMITWDPTLDCMVAFGTLKTACLAQSNNPHDNTCQRPLFRVFDILFLNDECLINYTLADRRRALAASIHSVQRRLEIHTYQPATTAQEIEDALRKAVAEASEGLVIKNPRSMYFLNERNDDWIKVKPDYMTEFGEELDLLIIGGYYGSGRRGGFLSSFLCGLRVDGNFLPPEENEESQNGASPKFWSFCKVGGGLTANDYKKIQTMTEGKWEKYDSRRPPRQVFELAGGPQQFEKPDEWIRPNDSVVVAVKAASVAASDQFRMGKTLRFPRFKGFKEDKTWREAMTVTEFVGLKAKRDKELAEKGQSINGAGMSVEKKTKRVGTGRVRKKQAVIIGQEHDGVITGQDAAAIAGSQVDVDVKGMITTPYAAPLTHLFHNMPFYVVTDSTPSSAQYPAKTKPQLESLLKLHGASIHQSANLPPRPNLTPEITIISDMRTVKTAALIKQNKHDILRSCWVFDCLETGMLVPLEPKHVLHIAKQETRKMVQRSVDHWGDSYVRGLGREEVVGVLEGMDVVEEEGRKSEEVIRWMLDGSSGEENQESKAERDGNSGENVPPGWTLSRCTVYIDPPPQGGISPVSLRTAPFLLKFVGAKVVEEVNDEVTHIVLSKEVAGHERLAEIREMVAERIASRGKIPRIVEVGWVEECVKERTWVDEERWKV